MIAWPSTLFCLSQRSPQGFDRPPKTLVSMVTKETVLVVAAGCILGLIAGGFLSSVVSGLLFGVGRLDPITYATWPAVVTAVAALAAFAAAARASSVSPSEALRAE